MIDRSWSLYCYLSLLRKNRYLFSLSIHMLNCQSNYYKQQKYWKVKRLKKCNILAYFKKHFRGRPQLLELFEDDLFYRQHHNLTFPFGLQSFDIFLLWKEFNQMLDGLLSLIFHVLKKILEEDTTGVMSGLCWNSHRDSVAVPNTSISVLVMSQSICRWEAGEESQPSYLQTLQFFLGNY